MLLLTRNSMKITCVINICKAFVPFTLINVIDYYAVDPNQTYY